MAQASRPLLLVVVVSVVLLAVWLLVSQPVPAERSQAPAQRSSQSPLAPLGAIERARGASTASDAANARIEAQGAAVEASP